jgi:hypothetical protein
MVADQLVENHTAKIASSITNVSAAPGELSQEMMRELRHSENEDKIEEQLYLHGADRRYHRSLHEDQFSLAGKTHNID